jgi:hypothetical protein
MAKRYDILLDEDFDLVLNSNGDLMIGECTMQNQQSLLLLQKGELKSAPLVGVGLTDWLLDEEANILTLQQKIQEQIELDGQVLKLLDISQLPKIKLIAEYV